VNEGLRLRDAIRRIPKGIDRISVIAGDSRIHEYIGGGAPFSLPQSTYRGCTATERRKVFSGLPLFQCYNSQFREKRYQHSSLSRNTQVSYL